MSALRLVYDATNKIDNDKFKVNQTDVDLTVIMNTLDEFMSAGLKEGDSLRTFTIREVIHEDGTKNLDWTGTNLDLDLAIIMLEKAKHFMLEQSYGEYQ